jgi:ferredoxin-NADP reductase
LALVEHKAILEQAQEVGPQIRLFRFVIPDLAHFDFVPGQWVSLFADVAGKKITRAYSLASGPDNNRFEICLNLVPDGHFTPFLFSLQPGDSVSMKGPVGNFTLRDPQRESIFVATGTGVVPYRAILRAPQYLPAGAPATLLFGARYEAGLMFHEEFAALAEEYPNLRYIPTVTRPTGAWQGQTGRIQPLLWDLLGAETSADVYICGLKEMVDDVREQLKLRGFDRKQIIYEKYD